MMVQAYLMQVGRRARLAPVRYGKVRTPIGLPDARRSEPRTLGHSDTRVEANKHVSTCASRFSPRERACSGRFG